MVCLWFVFAIEVVCVPFVCGGTCGFILWRICYVCGIYVSYVCCVCQVCSMCILRITVYMCVACMHDDR